MTSKNNIFFITGTDTEVGKTLMSAALLSYLSSQGFSTIAAKPISAGCIQTDAGLRNEDALLLQRYATYQAPYEMINPYAFLEPIAPMIAAQYVNQPMSLSSLSEAMQSMLGTDVDAKLIEGIGGWLQPLNATETLADYAGMIHAKVILVVGMRLGCINHSLLTVQSILSRSDVEFVGWIANGLDPNMQARQENIALLKEQIPVPCLGAIPYHPDQGVGPIVQAFDQRLLAWLFGRWLA